MRIVLTSLLAAACLTMSGCSGPKVEASEPSAKPRPANTLATFEGEWQCDVQRFAFSDLSEQDKMLGERLEAEGFSRDSYTAFKVDLATDPAMRTLVREAFAAACPAAGDGDEGESVSVDPAR